MLSSRISLGAPIHRLIVSPWSRRRSLSTTTVSAPLALHCEAIGENASSQSSSTSSPIVFLHGLLGHGRNLKTFAKQVCALQSCPGYLMDLRGHGQSRISNPHTSSSSNTTNPHTFDACANDIQHTISTQVAPQPSFPLTLVGHSWGGRMALQYAATQVATSTTEPASIERLWLLDTVPGVANESVEQVVETVAELQSSGAAAILENIVNKKDLVELLTKERGLEMGIAQWLASSYNLKTKDFGFDLSVIQGILPEFGTQDFDGMLQSLLERQVRVDIVRGGKNTAWDVPTLNRLEALKKTFPDHFGVHVLPKAGHWVHVDDLKGLVNLFSTY